MEASTFYIVGGVLVLAALVISAIGIRGREGFPKSNAQMAGVIAVFAVLVAGTSAFAVAYAREEQKHREDEQAEEEAKAEQEVADQEPAGDGAGAAAGADEPGPAQTLDLTSPADGSFSFQPDALSAEAGTITLAYDNPSPIVHNVAIEDAQSEELAKSDDVADTAAEATAPLVPGQYTYFCTIPGHREGGMEGTLEVE